MPSLHAVLSDLVATEDAFTIDSPNTWAQGRTLYGGITAALSAAAAARAFPELPPLRAAQLAFVGPASAAIRLAPRVLRLGRSATFVGVDTTGENSMAARALLLYAASRASEIAHDVTSMPPVPAPADCAPLFPDDAPRPAFIENFEVRFASGTPLLSRAPRPRFDIWVRHRDAAGVDPAIALLALADCLPPAAMAAFARSAPVSAMTWSIDFAHQIPATDWHLLRSTSEQAADGISLQALALWDETGRRLAVGRQTVALYA